MNSTSAIHEINASIPFSHHARADRSGPGFLLVLLLIALGFGLGLVAHHQHVLGRDPLWIELEPGTTVNANWVTAIEAAEPDAKYEIKPRVIVRLGRYGRQATEVVDCETMEAAVQLAQRLTREINGGKH